MDSGTRAELLSRLAEEVEFVRYAHPTRVAVDGPPAAGKTMLADELAVVLRAQGREVIRATIEDFLTPRSRRYRRGEDSAEGCYHDSFDFDALHRDQTPSRSAADIERRYRRRYMLSQQFYFDTVRPTGHADIIVHNDDLQRPAWEVRPRR